MAKTRRSQSGKYDEPAENIYEKNGVGYKDRDTGLTCMIRCFECGRENYALAVSSGYCSWCRYTPNEETNITNYKS